MKVKKVQFFGVICLAMACVASIGPRAAQAQWRATVGAQGESQARQVLAFFPNELWIHAGDHVTWTVDTDEIHTMTFLVTGQVRLPSEVGCPGSTPSGSSFDGTSCVNSGQLVKGETFTVNFPTAGNYKLVCLVHQDMTGVIHVLDATVPLPYNQDFYDDEAARERRQLLEDRDYSEYPHHTGHHHEVTAGVGEVAATPGGTTTVSVVRFLDSPTVIHVGQAVEWSNSDPATPHTITFGEEPQNPVPPSPNVTQDADGALHAIVTSSSTNVHSGFIAAAPQDRIGLPQSPAGTTRFRVTFPVAGTFEYKCVLHDQLGMIGEVIVLP